MNKPSIIRIVGCGLTGLVILIGVANGPVNATLQGKTPDGTTVGQPEYRSMIVESDDWESRL